MLFPRFKLKKSVSNNLIKFNSEPWKNEPRREFVGCGNWLDAKKLSAELQDENIKIIHENGKLFITDAPRYEHSRLIWFEIGHIKREMRKHNYCDPQDMDR